MKEVKNMLGYIGAFLVGYLVVAGVISLWNNSHYNNQFKSNFLTSCSNAGGSDAACACYYQGVKDHYSYQEAKALDARAALGDYDAGLLAIASSCASGSQVQ